MKKTMLVVLIVLLTVPALLFAAGQEETGESAWPSRSIQVNIWSSPGGDTDTTNRTMWGIVEEQLGTTVNCNNVVGAMGSVAASQVWNSERDGHTILGLSELLNTMAVLGGHNTTSKDWNVFVFSGGPGVLGVRADSPFSTLEELLSYAKANPGELSLGCAQKGSVWHVQAATFLAAAGVEVKVVPYNGSAPAVTACMVGEVDIVASSFAEQLEFLRSGDIRPLVTMDDNPIERDGLSIRPGVEIVSEYADSPRVMQYLGSAIPADTPEAITDAWVAAMTAAWESDKMQELIENRGHVPYGWTPDVSRDKLAEIDQTYMWLLVDMGLARESPETFGIERP